MAVFGLVLSIIAYCVVSLLFIGYIVLFIMKKNAILESFVNSCFMISLLVIMTLSWALILMNGGFNVNLYINVDYSWVLVISIPVLLVYEVFDTFQRRKIQKSEKWYRNVFRYLLPVLIGGLFFASTIVFFFNCNYFQYLNMYM